MECLVSCDSSETMKLVQDSQSRRDPGLTRLGVAKRLGKAHFFLSKCELGERRVDFVELSAVGRNLRERHLVLWRSVRCNKPEVQIGNCRVKPLEHHAGAKRVSKKNTLSV